MSTTAPTTVSLAVVPSRHYTWKSDKIKVFEMIADNMSLLIGDDGSALIYNDTKPDYSRCLCWLITSPTKRSIESINSILEGLSYKNFTSVIK